jgi:PEP-CTERM motif
MRRLMTLSVLAIGISTCLTRSTIGGIVTSGNILANPGAETGTLSGWTQSGVSHPFIDNGSFDPGINPHSGSFDFVGGADGTSGPSGQLSQTDNLLSAIPGLTAAVIEAGQAQVNLSFWEQGLNQGPLSDDGQVTLTFLNGSNAAINSVTAPEVDSHNLTWENYSNSYAVPTGTRSITYTMDFIRHVGTDLDAFFDDNSLTVTYGIASVPEPSSLVLSGIGALGLALYCWRTRRQPT